MILQQAPPGPFPQSPFRFMPQPVMPQPLLPPGFGARINPVSPFRPPSPASGPLAAPPDRYGFPAWAGIMTGHWDPEGAAKRSQMLAEWFRLHRPPAAQPTGIAAALLAADR